MTDALRHRGPDDEGYYIAGNVGLGHRRLNIIDLTTGHQPMSNEDGTVWITYNGETYNYLELRRELLARGHRFCTSSDTEVIVHAYEEYGTGCLEHLNGMFALALYDQRQGALLLARDRLGIKPLYYYVDTEQLLFASEIKALLPHPAIAVEPHWPALHEYLTFQFCLNGKTFFRNIRQLPPGHFLRLELAQGAPVPKPQRYWTLGFEVDTHHTEDYFVDRLMWLLQDAVRLQLRSDVPLGAHLSGGLDSSTIVCLASSLLGEPLRTFSGGFHEGPEYNETPYARLVVQQSGARAYEVWPTAAEFVETLPHLVYMMDEPAAGPGLLPQYAVSQLARQHVKVVLGGQGGDEVFGGYARYLVAYLEQCLKGAIFETQDEGRYVLTLESIIPALSQLQRYLPMIRFFWREGLFESMDRRYARLVDRTAGDPRDLFTPEFLATWSPQDTLAEFQEVFNRSNTRSYLNKMSHFDLQTSLPALLQVEDRTSMAVSLESRVPLLDHRIVELVASVPPPIKFRHGELKYLLKQAVRNLVPAQVLARKDKMGFPVPLAEWYAAGPVRALVVDTLTSAAARNRGIYRSDQVETLLASEGRFDRRIWGLLCLELWFQTFVDQGYRRP